MAQKHIPFVFWIKGEYDILTKEEMMEKIKKIETEIAQFKEQYLENC